jgi:hypothetical protein
MGKFFSATRVSGDADVYVNADNIIYVQRLEDSTRIVFNTDDKDGTKMISVTEGYEDILRLIDLAK